jgi:hypothetical protein
MTRYRFVTVTLLPYATVAFARHGDTRRPNDA